MKQSTDMKETYNYEAAEGFVLCWIPESLRPFDPLAHWNELKARLVAMDEQPQFPPRVFNADKDEYHDILPYQAREILDAWHDAHPQPEPVEPEEAAES